MKLKSGLKSGFDRRGGVGYTAWLGVSLCLAWTGFRQTAGGVMPIDVTSW
jgi:hypothetical protein